MIPSAVSECIGVFTSKASASRAPAASPCSGELHMLFRAAYVLQSREAHQGVLPSISDFFGFSFEVSSICQTVNARTQKLLMGSKKRSPSSRSHCLRKGLLEADDPDIESSWRRRRFHSLEDLALETKQYSVVCWDSCAI